MGDIFDLANAFLRYEPMTKKKVQELCYYAKAWYLAIYNKNLVEESFYASIHGAVQPELEEKYRKYGSDEIPKYQADILNIPKRILNFTEIVYAAYGKLSGEELDALNHMEEPWKRARPENQSLQKYVFVIREEDMKSYFNSCEYSEF